MKELKMILIRMCNLNYKESMTKPNKQKVLLVVLTLTDCGRCSFKGQITQWANNSVPALIN